MSYSDQPDQKEETPAVAKVFGWGNRATRSDIKCLLLAKAGLSSKAIAGACHLTPAQVTYRCSMAGIKLSDYRNGKSDFARQVMHAADVSSQDYVRDLKVELQKLLKLHTES